jgi:Family of unknown function (DUF6350)
VSDVLDRLRAPTARPSAKRAEPATSIWISGPAGAIWAALIGVVSLTIVTLMVWAAQAHAGVGAIGTMRFGAQLWLLAHRTPLRTAGGSLTIPPLVLTIGLGLLVARASAVVARGARCRDARDVAMVVVSVAAPYAVFAAVLAGFAGSSTLRPSIAGAFVCAAVFASLWSTIGAIRGSGLARPIWRGMPFALRVSLDAAARSAVVLVATAVVLMLASLIDHAGEFGTIASDYHGAAGPFAMVAFSVLLVPNAVLFSLAYLTGSGFAIGAGTSVGLGSSHLGAVPAFPLLAAVPSGGAPIPVIVLCVVLVIGAGAIAGRHISAQAAPGDAKADCLSLSEQLRAALVAATSLGIGAAVVVGFAGGPAGPGRLSAVGPSPWQVGFSVAAELSVVAGAVVLISSLRRRREIVLPD